MSFSATSAISKIASDLLQLDQQRQQQIDLHLRVAESTREVRDKAVDQGIAAITAQAQHVHQVKEAGIRTREAGRIDVWA